MKRLLIALSIAAVASLAGTAMRLTPMSRVLPIMWSSGRGLEVMQRIGVPMIGGMVSSTALTLVVNPSDLRLS